MGRAARPPGASVDAVRRCDRSGTLAPIRARNQRRVPQSEGERLSSRPRRHAGGDTLPAHKGVVRSVEVSDVIALVGIAAGPHRITAAVTRGAVEELCLAPGPRATAAVKATPMIEAARGRARCLRSP